MDFRKRVEQELVAAREEHAPLRNLHEGYAVLLEEVEEFWELVKEKKPDKEHMLKELAQISAMCQAIAEEVIGDIS